MVINSGSSSIKFQVFVMPEQRVEASGMVERIGLEGSRIRYKTATDKLDKVLEVNNHEEGLNTIAKLLLDPDLGIIRQSVEIEAVGHRVVHGGSSFSDTTLINEKVKEKIKELYSLAPLHNPHNMKGIEVAEKIFTKAKQIAVFDTAFHHSIPEESYRYAIPNKLYQDHQIRAYGFHGTSHKYVSEKAIKYLGKEKSKLVTVHLGNGCSITAVKNGKSVAHSLGFGPVNGLVMGTRSGDIDQSVIFYLIEELGHSAKEVKQILMEESGMLGLTGYSDLREIERLAQEGDQTCIMALRINALRIKEYIGAYASLMNGLDAVIFTAGIGENSDIMRALVCEEMDYLGIMLDEAKNAVRAKKITEIHEEGARTKILIIPTDEEIEIALQSYHLLMS